jgi:hypothetical protein
LSGPGLSEVVDHSTIGEGLFHVVVVEVDYSVAIREAFSLHSISKHHSLLSTGKKLLDLAIRSYYLLLHLGIGIAVVVVLLRELHFKIFLFSVLYILLALIRPPDHYLTLSQLFLVFKFFRAFRFRQILFRLLHHFLLLAVISEQAVQMSDFILQFLLLPLQFSDLSGQSILGHFSLFVFRKLGLFQSCDLFAQCLELFLVLFI